jgi:hypothetical protein
VAPLTDADLETLCRPRPHHAANAQRALQRPLPPLNEVRDTIVGDAALFARAGAILDD